MSEVTLVIDGVTVTGDSGLTILEAAQKGGINIPTLCHIQGLVPTGGCRVCVVEVEGASRLVGSCHTPATNGMVIKTRSAKAVRARKAALELMMAGHTLPCVTDPGGYWCELRRLAGDMEVGPPRFQPRRPRQYPEEEVNPYVRRNLSKCILCGRCVQACTEIAGADVLGIAYRGARSKVVVDCDVALDKEVCKDCGICIEYCPTTALSLPDGTRNGLAEVALASRACPELVEGPAVVRSVPERTNESQLAARELRAWTSPRQPATHPSKPNSGLPGTPATHPSKPKSGLPGPARRPGLQGRQTTPADLLGMLEDAQKEFGYVPAKFIADTAASLNLSVSAVYGVASFYSFLSLQPRGRHIIRVCRSVPCCMKDAQRIVDHLGKELGIEPGETTADGRFSLELANCIGACDVAPAMLVNNDVHGNLTPEKIRSVLEAYS